MVDNVKSYSDSSLFRIKVLEPAKKEINEFSDISFDFDMLKDGRRCYAVKFIIVYKNMTTRMKTELIANKLLDGN